MKPTERACPSSSPRPVRGASGRILAIDYGRKHLGLALSDDLHLTALPLGTLARTNRQNDLRRLRELCRAHQVVRIIVGHPIHLAGTPSEMSNEASRFATRLARQFGCPVELVDERLTSWEAAETAGGSSRRGRRLDDIAAAVILRDYLDQQRAQAQPLIPREAG